MLRITELRLPLDHAEAALRDQRALLDTLDRHLRTMPFLLGSRPSLADFGFYGQLQILSVDPTPAAEMRTRAPDVFCWLMRLDDASGVEGAWIDAAAPRSSPGGGRGRRGRPGAAFLEHGSPGVRAVHPPGEKFLFFTLSTLEQTGLGLL